MSQLMTEEVTQQARRLFEQLREPVRLLSSPSRTPAVPAPSSASCWRHWRN